MPACVLQSLVASVRYQRKGRTALSEGMNECSERESVGEGEKREEGYYYLFLVTTKKDS